MNKQELLRFIQYGESRTIEFKTTFGKGAIEAVVAFANVKGGKIIIGMNDDKNVVGVQISGETKQQWINKIKSSTSPAVIPDIYSVDFDKKTVMIIDVKEYPIKPVSYKGRYYKRVQNSNHLMNAGEIMDARLYSLQLSWDAYEYPNETIDSLDYNKIGKFIKNINETGRLHSKESEITILQKLSFIKNNKPTSAAMLLFAKIPLRMNIRVGRFKDDITIIDDRQITDTLLEAVEDTVKFIKTYMQIAYMFDGSIKRIEKWDYPLAAIREAVINAVIHRNYAEPSDIQIKIYDNKIDIFSPGKLYGDLTLEKLKKKNYQSSLRNKLLAEAFYLTGNIEKYGTGFIRIEDELKSYPDVSFEFKEIANGMLATFNKSGEVNEGVNEGVSEGVNEGVNEVLAFIRDNPGKRIPQIEKEIGVPAKTIERWLKKLKDEGILEFKGSSKTGGYYIK